MSGSTTPRVPTFIIMGAFARGTRHSCLLIANDRGDPEPLHEKSFFNGDLSRDKCHRCPDDVRQLWAVLEGKRLFPLSELVSCRRVLRDLL